MIKMALTTESNNNILSLKSIQLAFIYMPMTSLLIILSHKIGIKLHLLWKSRKNVDELSEEPSSLNASGEFVPDVAFPLAQLRAPLLNKEFQYTWQN